MNLQDLRTLLDYHYWARDRMFEALDRLSADEATRDLGGSFRSVHDTVAHLYAADHAWYSRWQGQSPAALLTGAAFPDLSAIQRAWFEHETQVRAFVESLGEDGISRVFEFTMLSGQPASSPFWPMLQHLVNHGSYHRGQVTMMLRLLGAQPPKSLDLITFYRTQGVAARG
jgi:uncharacterized damage-inducible protein DinB